MYVCDLYSLRVQLGQGGQRQQPYNFKVLYLYYFYALLQLYEKGVVILILELRKQAQRGYTGHTRT